jgi:hypothetical protein
LKIIIGKEVILTFGLSALMLISLFTVNALQVGSFEHLSTKETIIRYTLACFDSDENSSGYGGFAPIVGGKNYRWLHITREALELLGMLDAIDRVNENAVLYFINTSEIRILYDSEDGFYHPYYYGGMSDIYNALLSLNALDKLYLAETLVNTSALHYLVVNQSSTHYEPLRAYVFIADFFGWLGELNTTWYAERFYDRVMRDIMYNYGCPSSLGYGWGNEFYESCSNLMALSMVGGAETFTSDTRIITDFEHLIRTFLLLRWDSYNGGFDDDIGGGLSTHARDPRFVIASVKPSYVCLQLAKQMEYNLPDMLHGTDEWVSNAFARLVSTSQTKYGFFHSSLPRLTLYNYPQNVDPWDYSPEDNYYAVSLLNSVNRTQILDEGQFRWPPDSTTLIETYQKEGYLIPLVAAIVIVPTLIMVLIKKMKTRITSKENVNN